MFYVVLSFLGFMTFVIQSFVGFMTFVMHSHNMCLCDGLIATSMHCEIDMMPPSVYIPNILYTQLNRCSWHDKQMCNNIVATMQLLKCYLIELISKGVWEVAKVSSMFHLYGIHMHL